MDEDEEDTLDWLGIDLSGVRPEVVASNAGHNQKSELDKIVEDALRGLGLVSDGEKTAIQGWIIYGAALNKGRELFPSDEQFGEWVCNKLLHTIDRPDRAAAMWAAGYPEQFEQMREKYPKVRTVRGWHDKWKKESRPTTVSVVPTDTSLRLPDEKEAQRIRNLKDRAASTDSPAEREAVESKLNKYRDEGVDVDAVVDQEQEDEGRKQYYEEKQQRDVIARRIADHLYQTRDVDTIKSLILSVFPNIEALQKAESIYIDGAKD